MTTDVMKALYLTFPVFYEEESKSSLGDLHKISIIDES